MLLTIFNLNNDRKHILTRLTDLLITPLPNHQFKLLAVAVVWFLAVTAPVKEIGTAHRQVKYNYNGYLLIKLDTTVSILL